MKRKVLVAMKHPGEWNQYIPFNGYVSSIKKEYDYVVGVVAENAICLMTEIDEFYTVKNKDLASPYPQKLDTTSRWDHPFINSCIREIKKDFIDDDLTFVSWQPTSVSKGIVNINGSAFTVYKTSFKYAQDWYKLGKLIYPSLISYNKVSAKYNHLFNDKTYVVLTRNFKVKSQVENTKLRLPHLGSLIKYLTEKGIKIINVGFPPQPYKIDNDNYVEINDSLTQEDLISLFYLSKGVLGQASSGGFIAHLASNVDFFTLNPQWRDVIGDDGNRDFDVITHRTKEVDTIELHSIIPPLDKGSPNNFHKVFSILDSFTPKRKLIFGENKKIKYI